MLTGMLGPGRVEENPAAIMGVAVVAAPVDGCEKAWDEPFAPTAASAAMF